MCVCVCLRVSVCVCACLEGTRQPTFQTAAPLQSPNPQKKNKATLFITPLKTQTLLPLFSTSFRFLLSPSLLLSFLSHTLQPSDLSSRTWTRFCFDLNPHKIFSFFLPLSLFFLFCLHTTFDFILYAQKLKHRLLPVWRSIRRPKCGVTCIAHNNENVIDVIMAMSALNYRVKSSHWRDRTVQNGWTAGRWTSNCGSPKTPDHTLEWINAFVIMFMLLSPLQSPHVHIVPRA